VLPISGPRPVEPAAFGSFAAFTLAVSRKALTGFRRSLQCPYAPDIFLLLKTFLIKQGL
jgi:hypothetical protein